MIERPAEPPPRASRTLPLVTVIMPVFNEEHFIERSLAMVLTQDYPADRLEVIVADGMSTDRTREKVGRIQAGHPNVRLVDNPDRIVSAGMNRAIEAARGELIVRVDGHNEYPADYVRRVVELRASSAADNAGGVLVPVGNGRYVADAIAAAYCSPLATGQALRGHPSQSEEVRQVDTVYGGCWDRARLIALGKFDETMVRDQDDELGFRLRKAGGRIVQSTAIRTKYLVRDRLGKLFLQFAQYGYWKVEVVRRHPRQSSVRHFVPALFVLGVVGGGILGAFLQLARWAVLGLVVAYALVIAVEAGRHASRTRVGLWPCIACALMAMQVGYGVGFIVGWVRCWLGPLPTDRTFERVTR